MADVRQPNSSPDVLLTSPARTSPTRGSDTPRSAGADLTDVTVVGAWFGNTTSRGFTAAQLYSTASHQNHDLSGVYLGGNDLTGWNFAGQNLTNANFSGSTLTGADLSQTSLTNASFFDDWFGSSTLAGADLTGADTRGATGSQFAGATLSNTILVDG